MRVIAGAFKGRRLKAPTWEGLRPTSDKLRETLFNILAPRIADAAVLDVCAGTGAVGSADSDTSNTNGVSASPLTSWRAMQHVPRSSASQSPEPWSIIRPFCLPTSQLGTSTVQPESRSWQARTTCSAGA